MFFGESEFTISFETFLKAAAREPSLSTWRGIKNEWMRVGNSARRAHASVNDWWRH